MSSSEHAGLSRGSDALRQFLAGEDDLTGMLTKVAMIATETIPACDEASITLVREGRPTTPSYTAKSALFLDEVQYDAGDGPCLAAIRHRGVEHVSVGFDGRWLRFERAAVEQGVTATLSVPLGNDDIVFGGLNLYSESAASYDDAARTVACLFADQLGLAAARAVAYVESYELAHQLRRAMESRAVIEQAKGVLMAAEHCGPDAAFEILVRASQNRNRKLRAIAQEIVDRYSSAVAASR